jgi:hypothetical protein
MVELKAIFENKVKGKDYLDLNDSFWFAIFPICKWLSMLCVKLKRMNGIICQGGGF